MIIDAWGQHPTLRHMNDPIFDSLRRWTRGEIPTEELPVSLTTDEAIAVATKHEHDYIDTSAYTAKRYPPQLVDYLRSNGRNKVMFGTNHPMITPAKCLADLDALDLDDDTRAAFLGGTATRVFDLSTEGA